MGTEKKYRYPGINFFTKEDQDIFCGREDDAQKLFNRIMLNNTMVLHGESGTGKSSLVQAGLIPLLEKYNKSLSPRQTEEEKPAGQSFLKTVATEAAFDRKPQYLPVTIRFDSIQKAVKMEGKLPASKSDILVQQTLKIIHECRKYKEKEELPYIGYKGNSFWYTAKLFERNHYTLLLIFDQFEALQGYSYDEVKTFTQKLSELFVSTMPEALYAEYENITTEIESEKGLTEEAGSAYNQNIKFIEQPLRVKILFVIREDKLGTMSLLSDYFPDIMKNDFFLRSLDKTSARRAIIEPAEREGNFITLPFKFDEGIVEDLLPKLVDTNTGLYDPIQLQIVCSSIEKNTAVKKRLIKTADIGPVDDIIDDFYKRIWHGIKIHYKLSDERYEKKRKAIIDELVKTGRRNLALENLLVIDGDKQDEGIVGYLVKEGLIRKIPSGNDMYYQLIHDRLIMPLSKDLQDLVAKENVQKEIEEEKQINRKRKTIFLWVAAISLAFASGLAIYFYFQATKAATAAKEEKCLLISYSLKKAGNPTLGYVIAADWLDNESNRKSDSVSNYLRGLDTSNYVFLSGIYPQLVKVISAGTNGENSLLVTESSNKSYWNTKNGMLRARVPQYPANLVKRINTIQGQLEVFSTDSTIMILNDQAVTLVNLPGSYYGNRQIIVLSPDTKYLLIDYQLFNVNTLKITPLPAYQDTSDENSPKDYEQNAAVFLSNNRIAVSYENGKIRIYQIEENKKTSLKVVATLGSPDNNFYSDNDIINELAVDRRYQYLMAANSRNGVDVYGISTPATAGNSVDAGSDTVASKEYPYITELSGHTGSVKSMAFSSDNKLLLTGSSDGTAILWNVATRKKLAVLKVPDATELAYVGFSNKDRDLITISDKDIVYVWKRERPSVLYEKEQLYRFSPLDYAAWRLDINKDGRPADTTKTKELYKTTLHYLLNIPSDSEYPDDEIYTNGLKAAVSEVKRMYHILTSRKDFHTEIPDYNEVLLDKYYYKLLLGEPALLQNDPPTADERRLLTLKSQIVDWKIYFLDTTVKTSVGRFAGNFSLIANAYIDRQNKYSEGYKFITFYNDSVLQPFAVRHGQNKYVRQARRSVQIQLLKYYLYTGNPDEAIRIGNELLQGIQGTIDYNIYLVAAYLVDNRYDEAARLYGMPPNKKRKTDRRQTDNTFRNLLNRLKEKNIAVSNIDRFNKDFKLQWAVDND